MNLKNIAFTIAAAIVLVFTCFGYNEPMLDEPVSMARHDAIINGTPTSYEVGTVVSVIDDNVTVKTDDGTLLAFLGTDFRVGDEVELLIDTNGTNCTAKDDSIIEATPF